MKWLAIVLGVAACTPCGGQRCVTDGVVSQAQLQPELAKCAGQRVCLDPCQDLFAWTADDELVACKIQLDDTGSARLEATYIDWSVCAADESVDVGGDGYVDDDGTWDDGGNDGSTDDGGDDGTTDRVAPAHHAWSTSARVALRR